MTIGFKHKIDQDKAGGFRCPTCGFATGVIDSRPGTSGAVRRRRRCLSSKCDHRCTTYEIRQDGAAVIDAGQLAILARDSLRTAQALVDSLEGAIKMLDAAAAIDELRKA